MRIYFDTSAINALCNDLYTTQIKIKQFAQANSVYISCINITEIGVTPDQERRDQLLNLMKLLANQCRPLVFPSDLLRISLFAFIDGVGSMDASVGNDQERFWVILNRLDQMDEKDVIELSQYKQQEETWYNELHSSRPILQKVREIEGDPYETGVQLIKYFFEHEDWLEETFNEEIKALGCSGKPGSDVKSIFSSLETWIFFYGALIHGIYDRGIKIRGYSSRKNPGGLDTKQAIYLACCDLFVTNDRAQFNLIRAVNQFGNTCRNVILYDQFYTQFLVSEN